MEARRCRDLLCKEQARKCLLFFKKIICGGDLLAFPLPAPRGYKSRCRCTAGKGLRQGYNGVIKAERRGLIE